MNIIEEHYALEKLVKEVCKRIGGHLTQPLSLAERHELTHYVADYFGTTMVEIYGRKRARHVTDARHVLWFIRRTFFRETFQNIADDFSCNYSSVIHGVSVVSRVILENRCFDRFKPMLDIVRQFNNNKKAR